ncbi:MAG: NAD(P)H-hydrate dehydratase [Mongoliitalea sp.]
MRKILAGSQIKDLDQRFIQAKGMTSFELMEEAACAFVDWFMEQPVLKNKPVFIFAGKGNNGGDGVAIARLLHILSCTVTLITTAPVKDSSSDNQENIYRLPESLIPIPSDVFDWEIPTHAVLIDALLGVGLNHPLEGKMQEIAQKINESTGIKVAVDIPSGLPADDILEGTAVYADYTVTFQFPKLSLLFPEHAAFVGKLYVADIGISSDFQNQLEGSYYLLDKADIPAMHIKKNDFIHKGDMGKVMLIGGSKGKVGAILLASQAALRTGSGLVYANIPADERLTCQVAFPEIMYSTELLEDLDTIGVGPGWGTTLYPEELSQLFQKYAFPMVLDADAINLMAKYPKLLNQIPAYSILTPHLKEFERLVGPCLNHLERLKKALELATTYQIIVVLKGAYTCISTPEGNQYFNTSGNKYMATAGSGDVLTGMITSFLGQGYAPIQAALAGVFHHGLAGDIAAKSKNRGLIASDIVRSIPQTFIELGID